jgi:ribosomal protein L33
VTKITRTPFLITLSLGWFKMRKKLQKNIETSYKISPKEFFKLLKQLIEIESSLGKSHIYFAEWHYTLTPTKAEIEKFCIKYNLEFHSAEDHADNFLNYSISWDKKWNGT